MHASMYARVRAYAYMLVCARVRLPTTRLDSRWNFSSATDDAGSLGCRFVGSLMRENLRRFRTGARALDSESIKTIIDDLWYLE